MKILAGAEHRDGGEILLDGQPVTIDSPQKAMELGISIIYQEFNLVPYLSAGENIYLGREPRAALPGFVDFKTLYRDAQKVIDALGVRIDARTPVNQLSVAQQQMVEIAKATSKKSQNHRDGRAERDPDRPRTCRAVRPDAATEKSRASASSIFRTGWKRFSRCATGRPSCATELISPQWT